MRNKSIKSSHLVYLFYWFIKFIVGLVIDIIVTMYNITSHELNSVKISDSASDSHSVPRKKRSRSSSLPRVKKTRKRSSSLPSSSPHKKNRNRSSSLPPTSQQKKHESRLFTNDQKKKTNSNTAVHYGEYVCTDCNDTNIESRKNRFEHPRNYDVSKINKNIAAIQHIPETKLDPMQEYKKKILDPAYMSISKNTFNRPKLEGGTSDDAHEMRLISIANNILKRPMTSVYH